MTLSLKSTKNGRYTLKLDDQTIKCDNLQEAIELIAKYEAKETFKEEKK